MENTIALRECIDWMNSGLPFSFKCCSYDEKRPKKSGKWITAGEALCLIADKNKSEEEGEDENITESEGKEVEKPSKRSPNHRYFFTRNVRLCVGSKPVGLPIKIHLDLLIRFNGRKVLLP
jgi:hypothetical protein